MNFAAGVAKDERWKRPEAVTEALARYNLTGDQIIRAYSRKPLT